jgi:tetratricopeptide (TPR) repeat protein
MDLALVELKDNPRLGLTRAYVAYLAAQLGDTKRAQDEISQALQLAPGDNKVIRKAVLTYEALGQRDRAIQVLSGAAPELFQELDRQPDLADFRQDIRFKQVVAQIERGR